LSQVDQFSGSGQSREIFNEGLARTNLGQAEPPTMAVEFGDPSRPQSHNNAVGNSHATCRACGACSIGCEYGAKTTLDITYRSLAQRHGADIRALCEVTGIAGGESDYQVLWRDHSTGMDHVVTAPRLILAAGTNLKIRKQLQITT